LLSFSFETQDGLFDVAWSEIHENQIITASGDGSIKLWDITLMVRGHLQTLEEQLQLADLFLLISSIRTTPSEIGLSMLEKSFAWIGIMFEKISLLARVGMLVCG
jgi:WD40 repeat protein